MADPLDPLEPFDLFVEDVAAITGFAPATVQRLAQRGEIVSAKFGRRSVRFRKSDVAAYLARHVRGDAVEASR